MKQNILAGMISAVISTSFLVASTAECRVGGGRTFGSRGARGFSMPSRSTSAPYSGHRPNSGQNPHSYQRQDSSQQADRQPLTSPYSNPQRSSMLKSLGAGLAGGFLGSMLFRSLGIGGGGLVGGVPGGYGGVHTGGFGGFGILEILLLAGLIYLLYRMFMKRSETVTASDGAASLMRQARGWNRTDRFDMNPIGSNVRDISDEPSPGFGHSSLEGSSIHPEQAMDLFFQVQGAWSSRDLAPVQNFLDTDAKSYLDYELNRLKSAKRINRLENIAVRKTEIVESWQENGKDYSTVQFTANLLDFTIDENSQQVVEGSRAVPVKFEEYWTFSKDPDSSQWKLSAIQQN